MHHDKKICLALGILLVGVVAALFFRNESGAGQQAPQLADPKSLDAKIADKPVRPYEAALANETPKQPTVVSNAGSPQPQFTYDGFDSDRGKSFARPAEFTQLGPPEPIKPAGGVARLAQVPKPDPNAAWTAAGTSATKTTRPTRNVSQTTAAGMRTYRVQKGDTLSGIALKFLGTSRRYREIYKANRDVLRTPNSLREGMILRIPDRKANEPTSDDPIAGRRSEGGGRRSAGISTHSLNSQSSTNTAQRPRRRSGAATTTPTSGKRFVPVRRSPFLLGRRNGFVSKHGNNGKPQTSAADPGNRKPVTILPPPGGQPAAASAGQSPRVYVVKKGDSLERIARRIYGTPRATSKILEANRDRLKDANHLRAGMTIVLP